jgi:spore coat protein SA
MAAGLPVVVSNVGGMPEVIEHGKHGFLVEPRNWKEMADALEQLARNAHLREVISTACREKVRGQLTRENQVAGFKKFFGFSS